MSSTDRQSEAIAKLNDAFRKGERPELGRIVMTAAACELAEEWPLGAIVLRNAVKSFSAFTADNDPYGEHDFGSFKGLGETFFWKIDYYDRASDLSAGAEHPEDPETCERVMTIMLASDY